MKFSLPQMLIITFVLNWVLWDLVQMPHIERMYLSGIVTLAFAYLFNAHGVLFKKLKTRMGYQ